MVIGPSCALMTRSATWRRKEGTDTHGGAQVGRGCERQRALVGEGVAQGEQRVRAGPSPFMCSPTRSPMRFSPCGRGVEGVNPAKRAADKGEAVAQAEARKGLAAIRHARERRRRHLDVQLADLKVELQRVGPGASAGLSVPNLGAFETPTSVEHRLPPCASSASG